jgi:hypothetical protein
MTKVVDSTDVYSYDVDDTPRSFARKNDIIAAYGSLREENTDIANHGVSHTPPNGAMWRVIVAV